MGEEGNLCVDTDPGDVGVSADRLQRVDPFLRAFVDRGLLPGWLVLIARRGRVVHLSTYGWRDVEAHAAVETDTIFRIYSMTKPITSVAAMMLWEEGKFDLGDPVAKFIPAFAEAKVWVGGSVQGPVLEAPRNAVTMWHLLTHTSGLTYGFAYENAVDAMYRRAGYTMLTPPSRTLAEACDDFGRFPLLFHPGDRWSYSVATDVLGRVVEVISGLTFDEFLKSRIFEPLSMRDTGFSVLPSEFQRLASLYVAGPGKRAMRLTSAIPSLDVPETEEALQPPKFFSGGGGLFSTASDYHRFCQLLLGRGELDGVRLLAPHTLRLMSQNHLPGGVDLAALGRPNFPHLLNPGVGFGLGFSIVVDPVENKLPSTAGELSWGGAASTTFWVDPAEELSVVFLTQLIPSGTHPFARYLHQLVHQAIVD